MTKDQLLDEIKKFANDDTRDASARRDDLNEISYAIEDHVSELNEETSYESSYC